MLRAGEKQTILCKQKEERKRTTRPAQSAQWCSRCFVWGNRTSVASGP